MTLNGQKTCSVIFRFMTKVVFQIAKYSTKWTFIEDVGLKPEDAFRVETKANGEYLKYKNLPLNETANYRMRWKREILSDFGKRFRDPAFGAKTDDVRFYGKAYQKSFRKPGNSLLIFFYYYLSFERFQSFQYFKIIFCLLNLNLNNITTKIL